MLCKIDDCRLVGSSNVSYIPRILVSELISYCYSKISGKILIAVGREKMKCYFGLFLVYNLDRPNSLVKANGASMAMISRACGNTKLILFTVDLKLSLSYTVSPSSDKRTLTASGSVDIILKIVLLG